MRRLLLLLCLTLAMAVPAMADEVTLTYSEQGYESNKSIADKTTEVKTSEGVLVATIQYSKGQGNNNPIYHSTGGLRLYAKNTLTLTAAEGITLEKVVFNTSSGTFLANSTATPGSWNASAKTWTSTDGANSFTLTNSTSATSGQTRIPSITITYTAEAPKEPNCLTFGEDADATVYKGATELNLPVLTNPYSLAVTYESSKPDVATIDANGVVAIVAAGITTISAATTGNDTYAAGSVSYNLEVIDATIPPIAGYTQVSEPSQLVNGKKVIIGSFQADGSKAVGNLIAASGNNFPAKDVDITDGVISSISNEVAIFELGYDEQNGYSFKITNNADIDATANDLYLCAASSRSNYMRLSEDINYATVTIDNSKNSVIKFTTGNYSRNIVKYNSSSNIFSCYSSGQKDVQIYVEQAGEAYEAPAAVDATFEGNTSIEGENLYIVAGENVTVTLPVPEGVLAYYYINDDTKMIRYTAPFEVSAGDIVGYYTEQYGLKSEEKMFEVKGIDFSGIAPELKGFNGEPAVMVSFDLTGFDGSVWYKFNDAAAAAPALVTPAEEGYTEYAEPFKIAAVGTLTYKAESHGLMSAPVEKSITGEDLTTGVENVVVSDDSEAAYYDLNGRRLTNPAAGIYIRIAGGKATKAIIR